MGLITREEKKIHHRRKPWILTGSVTLLKQNRRVKSVIPVMLVQLCGSVLFVTFTLLYHVKCDSRSSKNIVHEVFVVPFTRIVILSIFLITGLCLNRSVFRVVSYVRLLTKFWLENSWFKREYKRKNRETVFECSLKGVVDFQNLCHFWAKRFAWIFYWWLPFIRIEIHTILYLHRLFIKTSAKFSFKHSCYIQSVLTETVIWQKVIQKMESFLLKQDSPTPASWNLHRELLLTLGNSVYLQLETRNSTESESWKRANKKSAQIYKYCVTTKIISVRTFSKTL